MKQKKSHITTRNILLQILLFGGAWLLIPLIFSDLDFDNFNFRRASKILVGVTLIIIVNIVWLLPNLYFKNKVGSYIIAAICSILVIHFCIEFFLDPLLASFQGERPRKPRRGGGRSGFRVPRELNKMTPFLVAFVGSALIEISSFANRKSKEALLLQSEKLATEMKLLKSQINPHFLFNALNNIYSLSYLKPEKTPDNLLKLSEMLRYMLYECNEDKVPLQKEITYLENYIDLKLLKDSRGMNVEVSLEKPTSPVQIAPMLLIPFVENAFKHSNIEDLEKGWIRIQLKMMGEKLMYIVENSFVPVATTKDKVGGIGLVNVNRQLDLLYPNRHQLTIDSSNNIYKVYLQIDLV